MVYKTLTCFPKGKKCGLCLTALINPQALGNICQTADVIVHYFCLLLASKIQQKGTDNQGLLGFFSRDIRKEIKRGSKIVCCYCKKKGATVICCGPNCSLNFHVPCAQDYGSLHQYFSEFKSFCEKHKLRQKIPVQLRKIEKMDCVLCCHRIILNSTSYEDDYLWPICCKPKALLHKKCLQSFALNAGYYFKCPFCSNKTEFHTEMKNFGIYIPEQEASWETEPNAYRELLERDIKCDAKTCVCPRGRDYSYRNSKWYLELCSLCGASGLHRGCMTEISVSEYECNTCSQISSKFTGSVTLNDTGNVAESSPVGNEEVLNTTIQHPVQENIPKNASMEYGNIVVISDSESEEVNVVDVDEVPSVVNLRKRQLHSRLGKRRGGKRQRLAAGGAETSSEICVTIDEENDVQLGHNSSFSINESPNCHQTDQSEINLQNTNHITECAKSPIVIVDDKDTSEEPLPFTISSVFTLHDSNEVDFDTNVICDNVNENQVSVDESNVNCIVLSSDDDDTLYVPDDDNESSASSLLDSESSLLDLSEIPEAQRSLLLDHFSSYIVDNETPSETTEKPKRRRKKKKLFTHTKKRKYVNSSSNFKGKSEKKSIETLDDKLINKLPDNDSVMRNCSYFSNTRNISNSNLSHSTPVSQVSSDEHSINIAAETTFLGTVNSKSIVGRTITQENKMNTRSKSPTHNVNNKIGNVNNTAVVYSITENVDLLSSSEKNENVSSPVGKNQTANYNGSSIIKNDLHTAEVHLYPNDSTSASKNFVLSVESVKTVNDSLFCDVNNSNINNSIIDRKTSLTQDLDNNKITASRKTCSNSNKVETVENKLKDSCFTKQPPKNYNSTNALEIHDHLAGQNQPVCALINLNNNSDKKIKRDNSTKVGKNLKRKGKQISSKNIIIKDTIERKNIKKLNKNNGGKPKIICSLALIQPIDKDVNYSSLNLNKLQFKIIKKNYSETSSPATNDNISGLNINPNVSDINEDQTEIQLSPLGSSDDKIKSMSPAQRAEDRIELKSSVLDICSDDKESQPCSSTLGNQKKLQSSKPNSAELSPCKMEIVSSQLIQSDDLANLQSSHDQMELKMSDLKLFKDQVEAKLTNLTPYEDYMKLQSSNLNPENLLKSSKQGSTENQLESEYSTLILSENQLFKPSIIITSEELMTSNPNSFLDKFESQSSKLNMSENQLDSLSPRIGTSGDLLQSYNLNPSEDSVELSSRKLESTEGQMMLQMSKSFDGKVESQLSKLNISSDDKIKSMSPAQRAEDRIELKSSVLDICSDDKESQPCSSALGNQKKLQSSKPNSAELSPCKMEIVSSQLIQSDYLANLQSSHDQMELKMSDLKLFKDQVEAKSTNLTPYEDYMKLQSSNLNPENLLKSSKQGSTENQLESEYSTLILSENQPFKPSIIITSEELMTSNPNSFLDKFESQSSKLNMSENQLDSLSPRIGTSGDLLQSYNLNPSEGSVELSSRKLDSTEGQMMLQMSKSFDGKVESQLSKLNISENQLKSLPFKLNSSEDYMNSEKTELPSSENQIELRQLRLNSAKDKIEVQPDNYKTKKLDWYDVCKTECSTCRNSIDVATKSDMSLIESVCDCDHEVNSMNIFNVSESTHSVASEHQIGKSNLSLPSNEHPNDTTISKMTDRKIFEDLESGLKNSSISYPSSSNFSSGEIDIKRNRDSHIYFSSETALIEPEILTSSYSLPQTCNLNKNCEEIKTTLSPKFPFCNLPDIVLSAEERTIKSDSFKSNLTLDAVQHNSSADSKFFPTSKIDDISSIEKEQKNPLNITPEFKKCVNNINDKSKSSVTMVSCKDSVTLESESRNILFKNIEVGGLKDDLMGQREESSEHCFKSKKELKVIKRLDKIDQINSENSSTKLQKQFACNVNILPHSENDISSVTTKNNILIGNDATISTIYPNFKTSKDSLQNKAKTNLEQDISSGSTSKPQISPLMQIENISESKIVCDQIDNTTENKNAISDLAENLQKESSKKPQIVMVKLETGDSYIEESGTVNKSNPRKNDLTFPVIGDNHEKFGKSSILNNNFKVRIIYQEIKGNYKKPPLISNIETFLILKKQIFRQKLMKTFFFNREKKAVIYTDSCGFRYVRLFVENIPKSIDRTVIFQSDSNMFTYLKSLIECHGAMKDLDIPQVVLIINGQSLIPDKDVFYHLKLASKLTNIKLVITTFTSQKHRILEFNKKLIYFSHVYGYHIWDISKIEFQ